MTVTLELTADEVTALSAALNVAVKQLGICLETTHVLEIHKKIERLVAAVNEKAANDEAAEKARPN